MWVKVAAVIWTIMVTAGSCVPGSDATKLNPLVFAGGDKIAHFGAYMVMQLLWALVLRNRGSRIGGARTAFYGSVLLGLLLEICQGCLFESRSFEIMDIIANIMGAIVGLVLFYKFF